MHDGDGVESLPSDKLKNFQIENLTRDDFESASGILYIDAPDALTNMVELNQAKLAVATFGGDGVLPNGGAIKQVTFTDGPPTGSAVQPSVGQVWRVNLTDINIVNGSSSSNTVSLIWIDSTGATAAIISTGIAGNATAGKLYDDALMTQKIAYLTNSLYLSVVGTQSDESIIKVPYQMVAQ